MDIDLHLQHTANVIVPHTDVLHLVMDGTYDTILDSGATCHVVNSIQYATPQFNFRKNTNPYDGIALGDNSIRLQSIGTCDIGILTDVMIVPKVSVNIISSSKLDLLGYSQVIENGLYNILQGGKLIAKGHLIKGLYQVRLHDFIPDAYKYVFTVGTS